MIAKNIRRVEETIRHQMMKKIHPLLFPIASISILAALLILHLPAVRPVVAFGSVFMFTSLLYLVMGWTLVKVEVRDVLLYSLIVLSLLVRLSFIGGNPIGSEDAFRYLWDGRVQSNGINPYLYTALDEHLNVLRSPLLPAAMNHADLKTIYFPLSQWIFYVCYQISGEALWSYKVLYLLAEIAILAGLFLILTKFGIPQKYLLLYALCPLPIIEFAVDAHLDAIGLPLIVFFLFFYLSGKRILSYVLLGLSMSIKPVGLILFPALFFMEKGWRNKFTAISVPLLTVGVQFLPYLFSSNPFETLFAFTKDWSFNGVIFDLFYRYFQDNQPARLYCAAILGVALVLLNLKRSDFLEAGYFSIIFLMLLSPVVHPWYVSWVAVLLPIVRKWSGIVLAAVVSLTSFTVMNFKLTGLWTQYPIVLAFEYIPVIVLLAIELRQRAVTRNEGKITL